jgi:hypothetical protein
MEGRIPALLSTCEPSWQGEGRRHVQCQAHPDKVLDIKGFYICIRTHGGEEDEERKGW